MYGIRVKTSNSGDGVTLSLCFLDIANSETYYKEELYEHEV